MSWMGVLLGFFILLARCGDDLLGGPRKERHIKRWNDFLGGLVFVLLGLSYLGLQQWDQRIYQRALRDRLDSPQQLEELCHSKRIRWDPKLSARLAYGYADDSKLESRFGGERIALCINLQAI